MRNWPLIKTMRKWIENEFIQRHILLLQLEEQPVSSQPHPWQCPPSQRLEHSPRISLPVQTWWVNGQVRWWLLKCILILHSRQQQFTQIFIDKISSFIGHHTCTKFIPSTKFLISFIMATWSHNNNLHQIWSNNINYLLGGIKFVQLHCERSLDDLGCCFLLLLMWHSAWERERTYNSMEKKKGGHTAWRK